MKIAIYGYGNLGRGVECAVKYHSDAELVAVFTRRAPEAVKTVTDVPVYNADRLLEFKNNIDIIFKYAPNNRELSIVTRQQAVGKNELTVVDETATCDIFAAYKRIYN